MSVASFTLNNGVQIPQLGFGVFQIPPEDTETAVRRALEIGYRHIDTAQMYGNEAGVGAAVASSGLSRNEVFLTTKLNNGFHDPDDALRATDASLRALGVDAVDLYLIHWPMPGVGDFVKTWRAMERILAEGKARAIGVSNFNADHLRRLFEETEIVPAVNQIEVHPYFTQNRLRAFNASHDIITEAWAPIAQGAVLDDPVIGTIAAAVDRSPAQVALRWHIQRGDVVFPKSVTPARMQENVEIFDFGLSEKDMAAIDGLDTGTRRGPDPETFNRV